MKVSKDEVTANRERILTAAARLFRERGARGAGVDALTEAAGLTHGSLYSHFASKDELMAEALTSGFAQAQSRIAGIDSLKAAVMAYLSAVHRDNAGSGCFMAALGAEMPRQDKKVRASFTEIVRRSVARHAAWIPKRVGLRREDEALANIATMVGSIVLARAVDDPEFSDRILAAARERLLGTKSNPKGSTDLDPSPID